MLLQVQQISIEQLVKSLEQRVRLLELVTCELSQRSYSKKDKKMIDKFIGRLKRFLSGLTRTESLEIIYLMGGV